MRISDWSSDVCSSDLQALGAVPFLELRVLQHRLDALFPLGVALVRQVLGSGDAAELVHHQVDALPLRRGNVGKVLQALLRSEVRRVGKECVSTCRSLCAPYHKKNKLFDKRN